MRKLEIIAAYRATPEYKERLQRHVGAKHRTAACKMRVEEFFAREMKLTPEQWREVEYRHRTGTQAR